MNFLDVIILIPLIWSMYKGFNRGLVVEVASLLALVLGVWCAIHFSEFTAGVLINEVGLSISERYITPVSFAVTFLVVAMVIVAVSRLIDKILSAIALGGINKLFGAIFGGLKALLILAILIYYVNIIDSKTNFIPEQKKQESLFYNPLIGLIEEVLPRLDVEKIKESLPEVEL